MPSNDNFTKVLFKKGPHSRLPVTGAIEGAFYLTTDTHRLYIGAKASSEANADTIPIELNKSITTVASVGQLPTSGVDIGQFYYVEGTNLHSGQSNSNGNILAVVTAIDETTGAPTWTQVNPDTNDNDHLSSVTVTAANGTVDSSNKKIAYTLTFNMVNKAGTAITSPTVTYYVRPQDLISAGLDTDVTVGEINTTNKTVDITTKLTDGTNTSTGDSFTLKAGDNVTFTKDNGKLVINTGIGANSVRNNVTYGNNEVVQTIAVNGSADNDNKLTLVGEKGITITPDPSGTPTRGKIGHTNSITAGNGTQQNGTTLINGDKFTAVTGVTYDAQGHITAETYKEITLPMIKAHAIGVDATDKSKLTIDLCDDSNNSAGTGATSGSVLFYKITVDGTESTIKNQASLGSFYSASAIDSMMRNLDALTYKGTIGAAANSPTVTALPTNPSNGDTYKVVTAGTYGGKVCVVGDLLIATGEEYQDTDSTKTATYIAPTAANHDTLIGTIVSPTWTQVANGAETDTTYQTKVTAGSATNKANVGILASTAGGNFTQYTEFSGDGVITVGATEGVDSNGKVALGHKNALTSGTPGTAYGSTSATSPSGSALAIGAGQAVKIPHVKVDAQGHVTEVGETEFKIPGDPKLAADTTNKKVKLQNAGGTDLNTITFLDGNCTTATVGISSSNPTVKYDHAVPTAGTSHPNLTATPNLSSDTDTNRQIVAISGISKDSYGHVTAIDTTTYTIEKIAYSLEHGMTSTSTHKLDNPDPFDSVTVTTTLKNAAGTTAGTASSFTLKSPNNSICITPTENSSNDINIDIIWGSF